MGVGFGYCFLPHGSGLPNPVRAGPFPSRSAAFPLSGATRSRARLLRPFGTTGSFPTPIVRAASTPRPVHGHDAGALTQMTAAETSRFLRDTPAILANFSCRPPPEAVNARRLDPLPA
jgi:hypothetical protein